VGVGVGVDMGVGLDAGVSINLYDINSPHLIASTPYSADNPNYLTHLLLLNY